MATRNSSVVFSFPASEVRSLPFPDQSVSDGGRAKRITAFVSVDDIDAELKKWTEVNPRKPVLDHHGDLKGPVAKKMVDTLLSEPETFVLKNIGIFLLAKEANHRKEEGGKGVLEVTLDDPEVHGVVNGGHTLYSILQARATHDYEPGNAFVPLHVLVGINEEHVVNLAEGLNRSLQVDDPSLANLAGTFDRIKEVMKGKPGEAQISYSQGQEGDIDIPFVLTLMACFNLNEFPDRKKHPNILFGQSKALLRSFKEDEENDFEIYGKVIKRLPEILVLSDRIQQLAFERCAQTFSRLKVSNAKKGNRAASPRYRRPAHFAGGEIRGKVHQGWLFPMIAGFRAAVSNEEWANGNFAWLDDPLRILDKVIEELVEIIVQEHQDNRGKPAEVGRKEAAYRLAYSAVSLELAQAGKLVA